MAESLFPRVLESWVQLEGVRSPEGRRGHRQGGGGVTRRACVRPFAHTPTPASEGEKTLSSTPELFSPKCSAAQGDQGLSVRGPRLCCCSLFPKGKAALTAGSQAARAQAAGSQGDQGPKMSRGCWAWEPCGCPSWSSGREKSLASPRLQRGASWRTPRTQAGGRQESGRPQPPGLSHLSAGDPPGPGAARGRRVC